MEPIASQIALIANSFKSDIPSCLEILEIANATKDSIPEKKTVYIPSKVII